MSVEASVAAYLYVEATRATERGDAMIASLEVPPCAVRQARGSISNPRTEARWRASGIKMESGAIPGSSFDSGIARLREVCGDAAWLTRSRKLRTTVVIGAYWPQTPFRSVISVQNLSWLAAIGAALEISVYLHDAPSNEPSAPCSMCGIRRESPTDWERALTYDLPEADVCEARWIARGCDTFSAWPRSLAFREPDGAIVSVVTGESRGPSNKRGGFSAGGDLLRQTRALPPAKEHVLHTVSSRSYFNQWAAPTRKDIRQLVKLEARLEMDFRLMVLPAVHANENAEGRILECFHCEFAFQAPELVVTS